MLRRRVTVTGNASQRRRELSESLHARNHFTKGTESHQNLVDLVDQTLAACTDEMLIDLHREYFHSPIIGKRIHTGIREELSAAQVHELAVLTSHMQDAENTALIKHVRGLGTYVEFGLTASENYALENERVKEQCISLINVSYGIHNNITYKLLAWGSTISPDQPSNYLRLKDEALIAYLLEHPESHLLAVKTILERGVQFSLDLLADMNKSSHPVAGGML